MQSKNKLSGFGFAQFNFNLAGLSSAICACEEAVSFQGILMRCRLSGVFQKFMRIATDDDFNSWVMEVGACTPCEPPALQKEYSPFRETQLLRFGHVFEWAILQEFNVDNDVFSAP